MRLPRIASLLACLLVTFGSAGASAGPDTDGDGVPDASDNCLTVPNAPPLDCDTDQDGYGNRCDGDFENVYPLFCNSELGGFFAHPDFLAGVDSGVGTDGDCNGTVNARDFEVVFLPILFGVCVGPSGLPCAGTVPCP